MAGVGAVLLVIGLALGSKVRGEILFFHEGENDNDLFRIKISALFGLLRMKYEIPVMYWAGIRRGLKIQRELVNLNSNQLLNEQDQKINRHTLAKRFEQLKILLAHTMELYSWIKSTLKHVRCTDFVWDTKIGLGDAPDTAISAGFIWGAKSSIVGYISRFVKLMEMPRMSVTPLFNETQFQTMFRCRFDLRIGFVLYTGMVLMWRILRSKQGLKSIKKWRNVLAKT